MNVTTYNGTNPKGKNISVIAGIHGNEITPIYILMKMVKESQFSDLTIFNDINKLTIINGVNDIGLLNNERDYKKPHSFDLNRTFIANEKDVIGELEEYLLNTDILIDIHSSPNCTEFALIDYNEKTNFYADWCERADVTFAVRYSNGNTLKKFIQDQGGASLTLEVDRMEKINSESANRSIKVIKNLLNTCLDKDPFISRPKGIPICQIFTYRQGIVEYTVNPGDFVKKTDLVAKVLNLNGDVELEVRSHIDGTVILVGRDYVNVAESICMIQDEVSWVKNENE
jgi:predicted deacylase